MDKTHTRRGFLKTGLALGAGWVAFPVRAVSPLVQEETEGALSDLEKGLASPLKPEARAATQRFLAAIGRLSTSRHRFALPENSEPCTLFRVHDAKGMLQ
jgi:hypothetical protein